ncbi:hypothetical protein BGZ72_001593, partial [Mortierella alpina]
LATDVRRCSEIEFSIAKYDDQKAYLTLQLSDEEVTECIGLQQVHRAWMISKQFGNSTMYGPIHQCENGRLLKYSPHLSRQAYHS